MPTKIATGCKFRVDETCPVGTCGPGVRSNFRRTSVSFLQKSTVDAEARSFWATPFSSGEVWKNGTDQVSTERCNFQNCAILDLGPSIIDLEVHTFGRF